MNQIAAQARCHEHLSVVGECVLAAGQVSGSI